MLNLSWRVNILFPNLGAISSVLKLPSTHHVQFSKQRQSEWTAINSLCGSYLMTEFKFSCYITNVQLQKTWKCHAKRFFIMDVNDIQQRQKYVKLIWNFERNLSIFITRNDIYGLTFYMSAQCAKGWFRSYFIRLNRFHNIYTSPLHDCALSRIYHKFTRHELGVHKLQPCVHFMDHFCGTPSIFEDGQSSFLIWLG